MQKLIRVFITIACVVLLIPGCVKKNSSSGDYPIKKIRFTSVKLTATGGNEGFIAPFVLPNMSAYCVTCASIGEIFFNQRLFLLHGQTKYIDILEKTLYNSMLSGISLSADRYTVISGIWKPGDIVYWFDDGPDGGCRLPDEWDTISFKPVVASATKIKVKLNKDFSAGIYEWIV